MDRDKIYEILKNSKTIAVVGVSKDRTKISNYIYRYLKNAGYKVYPVNPNYEVIKGDKCYKKVVEIGDNIDIVDVFRRPEYTPEIAKDAVAKKAKVLWLQQGISNEEAYNIAKEGGLEVLMDICIYAMHKALFK